MEQAILAPLPDALASVQDVFQSLPDNMQPRLVDAATQTSPLPVIVNEGSATAAPRIEWLLSPEAEQAPAVQKQKAPVNGQTERNAAPSSPSASSGPSAASGGYLARPSNIYAEEITTPAPGKQPVVGNPAPASVSAKIAIPSREEDPNADMHLVFKESGPAADEPAAHPAQSMANRPAEEPSAPDDTDDPKRRAAERINKLRNLSFNINAADPNNEFETVPAYIRRNLELYNTISNVENFYSNYEVKTDENNNTEISTINTFLDGKRPD
jgi:cell division protein FtsZ